MAEPSTSRLRLATAPDDERPLLDRDDDELILLARGGRADAFDALVRRHQARALAIATRYLGHPHLARDAAQNAFVELLRALPTYRAQGRFTAYWHRLLINQCHMASRSRRTRLAAHEQFGAQVHFEAVLADEALIARERQRDVERALETVSEKLRVVLALRFGGGLSLIEISTTLELPVGTVKSRLFAGLAALREALKEGPHA